MRTRLLVVEDDDDIAVMLKLFFDPNEFEVMHASSGRAAIDMARTQMPHLILLDVMLPDIDGYDVCYMLRQVAFTRYIPIIFLSQRDQRANKIMGLALGADDYITKPFDVEELKLRVQGSIRRATRDSLHERRSGLPTGALVSDERSHRQTALHVGMELVFAIEGLDAFREVYGFIVADDVFALAAHTIRDAVQRIGTQDDFVGVEADRFVLMTYSEDPTRLVELIRSAFYQGSRAFYTDRDLQRGAMEIKRKARTTFVPLMTIQARASSHKNDHRPMISGQDQAIS